jgi:hypothetical protein
MENNNSGGVNVSGPIPVTLSWHEFCYPLRLETWKIPIPPEEEIPSP